MTHHHSLPFISRPRPESEKSERPATHHRNGSSPQPRRCRWDFDAEICSSTLPPPIRVGALVTHDTYTLNNAQLKPGVSLDLWSVGQLLTLISAAYRNHCATVDIYFIHLLANCCTVHSVAQWLGSAKETVCVVEQCGGRATLASYGKGKALYFVT